MRAALLIGIAALLMIGCGAVEHKGKVTSQYSPAYISGQQVANAGTPAAAIDEPAMPQYQARGQNHPDAHETAVHNYHQQQRAKARNTDYWSVNKVRSSEDKEAWEMAKRRKEAVSSAGELGVPGVSNEATEKQKRETMRELRLKREAAANALDGPGSTKNRLDLSGKDLNTSKMPGNGLVGGQFNDHYITMEECPNHQCLNKARGNKAKMDRLGNPLGR